MAPDYRLDSAAAGAGAHVTDDLDDFDPSDPRDMRLWNAVKSFLRAIAVAAATAAGAGLLYLGFA